MAIRMRKTGDVYRGATGTQQFEVRPIGGSWDELFEELVRHPKVFYEIPTDSFLGRRELQSGEVQERTPSISVIQREMDRAAWYRGIVLGYQDVQNGDGKVAKDVFRVCMRTTELSDVNIPKRILELDLSEADFGRTGAGAR